VIVLTVMTKKKFKYYYTYDFNGVLERAVKLKMNNTWSEWDLIF
jgi:hypothetical protein